MHSEKLIKKSYDAYLMHGENSGWCFGHSGILDTVAKILSGINVGWRFGHSGVLDTVVFWSQCPKPCMAILTKW